MKRHYSLLYALLLVALSTTLLQATVNYRLSYNSTTQVFTVAIKSTVAYTGPDARLTGSSQITIVAPDPDGTGAGVFAVTNLTALTALQWGFTSLNSPAENTSKDYLFFAPGNAPSYTPFDIPANTYIDLFSFQTSSPCTGPLYLFDNVADPLNNNMSINADHNFKTLGGGNVNLYLSNDSGNVACSCVTYKLALDPDGMTYRVSFNSTTAYTGPMARIPGSSQFTVVFPDPDGAGAGAIQVTNLTALTALQFATTQLNSPAENPAADYVFFAPSNSVSYTPFNIPANTDIDLFTFKLQGGCTGNISLYDNTLDPLNTNSSVNADNSFKTLGGGNVNLYCSNTSGPVPCPCVLSNVLLTKTDASCFGTSTGALDATVGNGTAPYTYDWSDLPGTNNPEDRTGLAAGTYTVTVTDANGCTASASATVGQPPAAVTYKLVLDPDGMTYRVSFRSTSAYTGPLARIPGSSQFTVVFPDPDGAGAGAIQVTNLTALTALQFATTQLNSPAENPTRDYVFFAPSNSVSYTPFNIPANTDIDLFTFKLQGGCTGNISLYDNTLDPLNTNSSVNADNSFKTLGGGNVNLYCSNTSGPVPCPCVLSNVLLTKTDASCFGTSTGALDATVGNGTAPYTYDWSDLAGTNNPEDRTGLAAGTYTVTVTDANGCTASASATVGQPPAAVTYKLVLDPDGMTYRVSFRSTTAYTGPLARIPGSSQFTVVFPDPDGAGAGAIQVTNLTALTALQFATTQLNSPAENPTRDYVFFAPSNSVSYTPFNIPANTDIDLFTFKLQGGCTGNISLYDNTLDPLNTNSSVNADNSFKTLGGGNVNLYCSNTSGPVPCPCVLSNVLLAKTDASCFGTSTGALDATVGNGTAPYTYDWSDLPGTNNPEDRTGLAAGTYTVTVTDANGCTASASATIGQPPAAVTYKLVLDPDGMTYRVSFRSTSAYSGPLARIPGSSQFTVVFPDPDGAGAGAIQVTNLTALTALQFATTQLNSPAENPAADYVFFAPSNSVSYTPFNIPANTDIDLFTFKLQGGCTGNISLYHNTLDPLNTNSSVNADNSFKTLGGGNVNLYCSNTSGPVPCPCVLSNVILAKTDASCFGTSTGALDATVGNGTAPYTYDWSDLPGTNNPEDRTGLAAGTYTVTVTDANGCTASASATVGQPPAAVTYKLVLDPDGMTYRVSFRSTSAYTGPLARIPGSSQFTVVFPDPDGAGAGAIQVTNLTALTALQFATTQLNSPAENPAADYVFFAPSNSVSYMPFNIPANTDIVLFTFKLQGGCTGNISLYDNTLDPLNTNSSVNADNSFKTLGGGNVNLYCSNTSGPVPCPCVLSNVILAKTDASCFGTSTGALDATVGNGTAPYTYDWSDLPGTNNPEDRTGLAAGTYTVTVTDANGCTASATATVGQPPAAVTYKLVLDPDGMTYRVSFRSTSAYTGPLARIPGSSQFTVVFPDPDGAGAGAIQVTNLTALTALQFATTQLNSPAENPTQDYVFFAPSNSVSYTPFNIPANTDIDLFTFQLQGGCTGDLYLYDNALDPLNANNSVNADNSFKTLGGGNVNLYCSNTSGLVPCPCMITDLTFTNRTTCDDNGTPLDQTDDYYVADITVVFGTPPVTGTLDLTGDVVAGGGPLSQPVATVGAGPMYTFTGVRLKADNTATSVTATFSATPTCTFEITNGPVVSPCSPPSCPTIADAGADQTICGAVAANLNATSSATGTWSGGSGTFANAVDPGTSYTPTAGEVGTTVILTWTTFDPDGAGPCTTESDMMSLTINTPATASAGADQTICGLGVVNLNAATNGTGNWTGGAGSFGNASSAATTYTPTAGEVGTTVVLTWTTTDPDGAGPCALLSDAMSLMIHTPATANAGADQTVCGAVVVNLNATTNGAGSWSGGAGTFGNASSAATTYIPTAGEVGNMVVLTWTTSDPDGAGPCTAMSDAMILTVNTPATAGAGLDQTVCGIAVVNLSATTNGTGTWSGGAGTFANASSAATTYTPTAGEVGTTVVLTWTTSDPDGAGPCASASDALNVTINTPATANAGADQTVCGAVVVNLSATTNGTGSWSGGAGTFANASNAATTYTPTAGEIGTTVILTWTTSDLDGAGPCIFASDGMSLTINLPATANAGADQMVCGMTTVNLSATTNGTGIWSGGAGAFANASNAATTYTPTAGEVGTTVVLTWTTADPDGAGPCTLTSDAMNLTINTPATANAGADQTVCGVVTVNLSATTNGTGSWSGGAGTFANASNAVTTYTPTAGEIGATVVLTWTTSDPDGAGPCVFASDAMNLTVNTPATANAGADQTVCGVVTVNLGATTNGTGTWSGGAGTFANASNAVTTYTPTAGEIGATVLLTWTTSDPDGAGPCVFASDAMNLTVNTPVTANAGADQTVCGVVTVNLSATTNGTGFWSGGAGTFANASNAVTTYTPTAGEIGTTVVLTWTTSDPDGAGPCALASDVMSLTINTPATANAGADQTVCGVVTVNLSATTNGMGSWSGGAGTFANASNAVTTYTPTAGEIGATVLLTWTTSDPDGAGPCVFASDAMNLTVNTPVTANAGADQTVCGVVTVNLSATTNGTGSWSGGAGTFANASNAVTTYTPTAGEIGTTVVLTWSTSDPDGAGPCAFASDGMSLTINTPATANAGADQTVCGVVTVNLGATTNGTGTWSGGAGTFANASNAVTTYTPTAGEIGATVLLTWTTSDPDGAGPCVFASDAMNLTVNTPVTANAGADQTVCGVVTVNLSAMTNGTGTWSGGAGTFANASNAVTTYTPTAGEIGTTVVLTWSTSDPDGAGPCAFASDGMSLTINTPATANAGTDQTVCGNLAVNLTATTNGTGNWSGGIGTFANASNAVTTYTPTPGEIGATIVLTWTTADPDGAGTCISASDAMNLTINPPATANAGADQTVCGAVTINLSATTNGTGTWSGGAGTFGNASSTATIYTPTIGEVGTTVVLTWTTADPDGAGPCASASDAMNLTLITPATANAGVDQTICGITTVNLTAITNSAGSWSGGAGTFGNSNSAATTYSPTAGEVGTTVVLTWTTADPDGVGPCTPASDAMNLVINTPATANAGVDQTICGLVSVSLSATTNGTGSWSGGAGVFGNANSATTTYTPTAGEVGSTIVLTWTTADPDGAGPCILASDAMNLTIITPATADAGPDQTVCGLVVVNLSATSNSAGSWSGGAGSFGDANSTVTTYTPTAGEVGTTVILTWTTLDPDGAGPCTPVSDAMNLTINTVSTANAGADQTVCGVMSANLTATASGAGSWSGGAGTFGNVNSAATTYIPTIGEVGSTIVLTWTTADPDGAGPCILASDAMNLTIITPATADAGADQTICGITTVNLTATTNGAGSWSGGAGTFGNVNNAATTYAPTAGEVGTTIILTWTTLDPDGAGPCSAASDAMSLTINTPATASAGSDQTVCGISVVNLNATSNGAGNWSGGAGTFGNVNNAATTYTPAAGEVGTTVVLTWTTSDPDGAGPCASTSDAMNLIINTVSTADAGADQTVCGASIVNLSANNNAAGSWSGGAGTFGNASDAATTYTPTAGEIGTTVVLTWTTSDPDGAGPCASASDAMNLTINTPATANAGADQTVCGAVVVNLSATTSGTGSWSGGAGTFGNASNAATTYTPTAGEVGTTVILTWTTLDPDGAGPCTSASDAMNLTFNPPASANAGADQTVCSAVVVNLTATTSGAGNWSGGAGTFGNVSNAATTYTPTAGEVGTTVILTWTTSDPDGAGPCAAASDAMNLTINTPATANAGADQTVCGAVVVSLSATSNGTGSWSGGAGTFGNVSNAATTYTPTAGEVGTTVILTWTTSDPDGAGPCAAASDAMNLIINTPAIANAGADQTVCGAVVVSLSATSNGAGSWSGGAGTFGNVSNATTTYTPTAAEVGTTVILTWTTSDPDGAGPCAAASDAMNLIIYTPATANAGADQTVCGAVVVNLTATTSGAGSWSGGAGTFGNVLNATTTYTPTAAEVGTTVILTWTTSDPDGAGPCAAASDAMNLIINTPAIANAGADQTVCGAVVVNLSATTSGAGSWSGGAGTFGNVSNAATTYTPTAGEVGTTVVLTWTTSDPDGAGPCAAASDAMNLIINTPAIANAGADQTVCGAVVVNLSATTSGAGSWSGGAGTFGNVSNAATTYTPTAAEVGTTVILTWTTSDPDGAGPCAAASDAMNLIINTPAIANAGADQTVCGAVVVSLSATSNGTGSWSGGAGTFGNVSNAATTYTPTAAEVGTTVILTWTTSDPDGAGPCAAASDAMNLIINTPAIANAGADQTVCGAVVVNLSATTSGAGSWSGGAGTFGNVSNATTTYTPTAGEVGTTVILTWTTSDPDGAGPCAAASDAMNLIINTPAIANAGADQTVCGAVVVSLSATSNGAGSWSGGAGTFGNVSNATTTYTPTAAEVGTTVILTWTTSDPDGAGPCAAASDAMNLIINTPAIANAGADQTVCGAVVVSLSATSNGTGSWSGGAGTFGNVSNAATTYTPTAGEIGTTVVLTWTTLDPDGAGPCASASDAMNLIINTPASANAGADQTVCGAVVVSLSATTSGAGSWSGGAGTFGNVSNAATTYTPTAGEVGTTVILTWTTLDPDGAGPCASASDAMNLIINIPASANAGADQTVCSAVVVNLTATTSGAGSWSGGAGTFGNVSNAATTYTPTAGEVGTTVILTWTTSDPDGAGPCAAASDAMNLIINTPAIANAGADQTVCGAVVVSLSATSNGAGSWSGGAGTFGNVSNATTTYTPTAAEVGTTVILTWTTSDPDGAGPCAAASDAMNLIIYTPATANAGADQTVCGAVVVNLTATTSGAGSWSGGAGTFGNVLNATTTYTPTAAEVGTTVILTWTTSDPDGAGPCAAASDAMNLIINTPAIANAGADQTVCGAVVVNLSATTSGAGSWSGGAGTFGNVSNAATTYTPTAGEVGTTVVLTWTTSDPDGAGPCAAASDAMNLIINTPAIANAGADQTVCGAVVVNLSATTSGAGSWSGGAGTFGNVSNAATTYTPTAAEVGTTVILTWTTSDPDGAGPCAAASDAMNLIINTPAIANAGADQTVCGAVVVSLSATSNGTGSWSGGAGTFGNVSNAATTYTPTAGEIGTTVVLTWTTLDPDGAGPCAAASDAMNLIINTPATANAGADQTVCGAVVVSLSATSNGTGSWSGGAGTFGNVSNAATTYTPTAAEVGTTVILTWTTSDPDGAGPCAAASDAMNLIINTPAIANAGADQTVCGAVVVNLSATTSGAGSWSGGAGTFGNVSNAATTYTPTAGEVGTTVILTWTTSDPDGAGPCAAASDAMNLIINTPAIANAGADQTVCGAVVVNLSATTSGAGSWSGGAGTFGNVSNATTTYTPTAGEVGTTVILTWTTSDPDGAGPCAAASDAMNLIINTPAIANAGADQTVCGAVVASLSATSNGTGSWSGGAGTFGNVSNATTSYMPTAGEVGTTVILTWTTSDPDGAGPCASASDAMNLIINTPPASNAGPNQMICLLSATLAANTPVSGTGLWTVTSGPSLLASQFSNTADPLATFTPAGGPGAYVLTWTISNPPCAPSPSNVTITVGDLIPPVITCPVTGTVEVNVSPGQCCGVFTFASATATDNCAVAAVLQINGLPTGQCFYGTSAVVWQATDLGGNTATCSFTIKVNDSQNPTIICPVNIVRSADPNLCSAVVNYATPFFSDNCSGVTIVRTGGPASGSAFPKGITMVNWKATDTSGNMAICGFTVTVNDNQLPAITCPPNINKSTMTDECAAQAFYAVKGLSDNCPGVTSSVMSGLPSGSNFPKGTSTIVLKATDAAGLTKTCSFTITVTDAQAPAITCSANISKNTDPNLCTAVVTYVSAAATDNCAPSPSVSIQSGLPSGSTFPKGTTTVIWKATDGAGLTKTCSFKITVNDAQDPVITCPANIATNTDPNQCSAVKIYANATFTDNCAGGSVSRMAGLASGSAFPKGVNTVVFKATDASGNIATCLMTVTVTDAQLPTISCPANLVRNNDLNQCYAIVDYTTPAATDNCPNVQVALVSGFASQGVFQLGITNVVWKATDASGQAATCSFTVTVNDTQAPMIMCPGNRTVNGSGTPCGYPSANLLSANVMMENCPGFTLTSNAPATLPGGVTHITWMATDAANNVSTCSYSVMVSCTTTPWGGGGNGQSKAVSVSDNSLDLLIAPNPATSEVTFRLEGVGEKGGDLRLYDPLGRMLWQQWVTAGQTQVSLDVNRTNFASGVYQVILHTEYGMVAKQLVITKL